MIVQCPQCSSRYRVNDANVPSSGGRITCPSCGHKFVVYPDQDNTQHGGGQPPAEDPDKTSVVERPNLDQLAGAMRGGGGPSGQQEDDAPATEVMSGDALNGMFGGKDPTTDEGTVEMQNPYSDAGNDRPPEEEFEVAATEVVSGDAVGGMFEGIQNQSGTQQSGGQGPGDPSTEVESSPPDPNNWQQQNQQGQPQARQQRPSSPPSQPQQPQQGRGGKPPARTPEQSSPQAPGAGSGQPKPASPASTSNDGIREFTPDESQEPPSEPASPDASAETDAPGAEYDGPWKLKTNFGLTYEFPDTSGLKNWLSNREELDGYKLAGEDGDFRPLDDWPQLGGGGGPSSSQQMPSYQGGSSPSPPSGSRAPSSPPPSMTENSPGSSPSQPTPSSTQPPSSGTSGSGPDQKDSIPPGRKINPQEFRPPSQEAKWNKILWVVFLVLAIVATAIGLQTFEVYDVKGLILGVSGEQAQSSASPAVETDETSETAEEGEAGAAADGDAAKERQERLDKQIEQLMGDAKRALENNRLQTALDKLDRAKTLDPKRPKVFDMLATVYTEMGQTEDAESAQAEAKRLREQSLSKNEKGADGAEKSEN
ncbi:MAG: zinc-ribbon domain-containing protein [Myxococcota bacterium]